MHDVTLAPFAKQLRFSENNVEMAFPDGSWDTITMEVGSPLVLSDPATGQVGIYTTILQNPEPTFAAVRLKVVGGRITEIEHILSTRRNLSAPPTPFGDIWNNPRDPDFVRVVPAKRATREQLKAQADGYFFTLQFNNGEIRGAICVNATRARERCMQFTEIEQAVSGPGATGSTTRARPGLLAGGRGAQRRDVPHVHRSQRHAGRVHARRWHKDAFDFPRAADLVGTGIIQGEERPDHCGGGDLHRGAVFHPLAVCDPTGSGL
jgi:hypothetical protein